MKMMKTVLPFLLLTAAAFGQYTAAPGDAPPSDLAPAIAGKLQKQGTKIMNGSKVFCQIWLVETAPHAGPSKEANVTLPMIPQGALLGAIQFPARASDRRGNPVPAGVYTLRYSNFPENGDHQGVAPQRDFMLLSKAADDKDPAATPDFKTLVDWSEKAMGNPHPGVFSFWKQDSGTPGLALQGDSDWVWQTKLGDLSVAVIVVGKVAG